MSLSTVLSGGSVIDLDGTLFIQLGIFFVALLLLNILVFKPMIRLFDAREASIEGAREEARKLQAEAKKSGETFDEQLRKVKLSAGQDRDRLRSEAQHLERTLLAKVRDESRQSLTEAEEKLAKEATKVRKEIDNMVPALARGISEKVLGRGIS